MWFLEYPAVSANMDIILVSLTQQLQGEPFNVHADPWTNETNLTEIWDYFKFTLEGLLRKSMLFVTRSERCVCLACFSRRTINCVFDAILLTLVGNDVHAKKHWQFSLVIIQLQTFCGCMLTEHYRRSYLQRFTVSDLNVENVNKTRRTCIFNGEPRFEAEWKCSS